jgi:hypothetical protein
MIFFDKPYATICWDDTNHWLVLKWIGVIQGEKLKEAANKAIELLKLKGGSKWLADDSEMGAWSQEDVKWLIEDWHPRAVAAGLRYMAIVNPGGALGRLSSNNINRKVVTELVTTVYFGNIEEAKNWLNKAESNT